MSRETKSVRTPASEAAELAFTEDFFRIPDGLNLHYRDYRPVGQPSGQPVLCLHGLTRNLKDFEDLAPRLAGLGLRVIAVTQRGRGHSDFDPQPQRYTPLVYTQDMLALLDHLGIDQAIFIGTSMGGLMTMIASTLAPGRAKAVILNDIGPELGAEGLARIRSYAGKTPGRFRDWHEAVVAIRGINRIAFPDETGEDFWLGFARKTCREMPDGSIGLDYDPAIVQPVAEVGDADIDLWPLFGGLKTVPTLVVRGELSDLLMPSTVEEMKRRKPDLRTVGVPRVGHAPFLTEAVAWQAIIELFDALNLQPGKP